MNYAWDFEIGNGALRYVGHTLGGPELESQVPLSLHAQWRADFAHVESLTI